MPFRGDAFGTSRNAVFFAPLAPLAAVFFGAVFFLLLVPFAPLAAAVFFGAAVFFAPLAAAAFGATFFFALTAFSPPFAGAAPEPFAAFFPLLFVR
jgi:hypothetical protein